MSLDSKLRLINAEKAANGDPTKINAMLVDPTVQRMCGITVHGSTPFDVPFVTQIKGNLWQGGCQDGLVLPKNFRHLVSLYPWEKYTTKHELDSVLVIRMFDSDDEVNVEQLLSIAEWVNSCQKNGPTLVHCQAGLNRSSLVTGMALMMEDNSLTGEEVISLLREKRSPACLCNKTFEKFIKEWEWVKS